MLPDNEVITDFDTQPEAVDVTDCLEQEVWRLLGWDVPRGDMIWGQWR